MLNLSTIKYITNKSNCYRIFVRNNSLLHASKSPKLINNRYVFGSVVSAGVISCGSWITWCTCQDSKGIGQEYDSELKKWKRWVQEIYRENIINSSTVRFGRAAVAVSVKLLLFYGNCY